MTTPSLDELIEADAIVTRNAALTSKPELYTQYVIRSNASQWFWCGGRTWSVSLKFARRFDSMTAATIAAMEHLPESPSTYRIEPIAPVEGI
jgi:hypothetical protein